MPRRTKYYLKTLADDGRSYVGLFTNVRHAFTRAQAIHRYDLSTVAVCIWECGADGLILGDEPIYKWSREAR